MSKARLVITAVVTVTILDADAVLAFLKGEVAADAVRPLLDDPDSSLTSLGVAEVLDHLVRLVGAGEEDATLDLAQLGVIDGRWGAVQYRPFVLTVLRVEDGMPAEVTTFAAGDFDRCALPRALVRS